MVDINKNSFESKSFLIFFFKLIEEPDVTGHQDLKNNTGTIKYRIIIKIIDISKEKSTKNVKKSISATKNNDPGKPKNISKLIKIKIKSFVFNKPIEFISVVIRVLYRLLIASTSKKN
jgi:hypothetical protein